MFPGSGAGAAGFTEFTVRFSGLGVEGAADQLPAHSEKLAATCSAASVSSKTWRRRGATKA